MYMKPHAEDRKGSLKGEQLRDLYSTERCKREGIASHKSVAAGQLCWLPSTSVGCQKELRRLQYRLLFAGSGYTIISANSQSKVSGQRDGSRNFVLTSMWQSTWKSIVRSTWINCNHSGRGPSWPPLGDNKKPSGKKRGKQTHHVEGKNCTAVPLKRLFHNLCKRCLKVLLLDLNQKENLQMVLWHSLLAVYTSDC